ncbi:GT2 family glycosyltransferase [Mesorhizobium sp. J18]|uniref:glycosyltransferase family 2 protein n=1 Tax=Mesorhizobium sp. J18 TaxID=935263 RepID=UPI001199EA10|nr:glycosyltransferase family 2 protein [Mesorhizobium sp. J18]TWG96730.1 GT2 family glycosyltransferase [Mesorhizobium sp. J18]
MNIPPRDQTRPDGSAGLGTPPLAVVVVTYNSASVISGLLDSLPAGLSGIPRVEVIIVDNDSKDRTVELTEAHTVQPKVIRMGRNAGYAAGINAASFLAPSGADLLILNPDIRLRPGTAATLRERLRDGSVGVAVPKVLHEDGSLAHSVRREPSMTTVWADALLGTRRAARLGLGEIVADRSIYERGGSVQWATGAILMVSARARRIVGEWDESFFLYSEEVDYLRRVRERGGSVVYVPEAEAVHIGGDYQHNPYLSGLMTANRIRYFRRHHGVLPTGMFRLGIIAGETMRFALGPGHRAALRAALTMRVPVPRQGAALPS